MTAARKLARKSRPRVSAAEILRLARFPAIRAAISEGLKREVPKEVTIPRGGRYVRFTLRPAKSRTGRGLWVNELFSTISLGTRGTRAVIGTMRADVKKPGELRRFLSKLRGASDSQRRSYIYQMRRAGIIGGSKTQAVLVPKQRVIAAVAKYAGRRIAANPILATLGIRPNPASNPKEKWAVYSTGIRGRTVRAVGPYGRYEIPRPPGRLSEHGSQGAAERAAERYARKLQYKLKPTIFRDERGEGVEENPRTAQQRFGRCPKGKVRSRSGRCVKPIGYRAKKGKLYGWHTDLPAAERHEILGRAVRKDGYATIIRRLTFLVNISADQKTRMVASTDRSWLQRNRASIERKRVAANPGGYYVMTYGGGRYTSVAWYPTKAEAERHVKQLKSAGLWSGMPPKVESAARNAKSNPRRWEDFYVEHYVRGRKKPVTHEGGYDAPLTFARQLSRSKKGDVAVIVRATEDIYRVYRGGKQVSGNPRGSRRRNPITKKEARKLLKEVRDSRKYGSTLDWDTPDQHRGWEAGIGEALVSAGGSWKVRRAGHRLINRALDNRGRKARRNPDPDKLLNKIDNFLAQHRTGDQVDRWVEELYQWIQRGGHEPDWARYSLGTSYYRTRVAGARRRGTAENRPRHNPEHAFHTESAEDARRLQAEVIRQLRGGYTTTYYRGSRSFTSGLPKTRILKLAKSMGIRVKVQQPYDPRQSRGARKNPSAEIPRINIPFRDGQKVTPGAVRNWLRTLPTSNIKAMLTRRFEQNMRQYRKFHLGAEPTHFTYKSIPMGASKNVTDVDFVTSEGKEWSANYQVPKTSGKYDPSVDGRYIHSHGESGIDVTIKKPAKRKRLPERFHTADGKFVGVIPSRNVKITDWYRG